MSTDAKPWAFAVLDSLGRRSVYLDQARAIEVATQRHGTVVPLVPAEAKAEQAAEQTRNT